MKKLGIGIIVLFCGIALFLSLPSNYYLRQALMHLTPQIDQYPIFENRVIKAGNPQPWELHEEYNKQSIPSAYTALFEKYETVAFVVIKDNKLLFEEYWDGYSSSSLSNSFSMAKSIVSLAVGCAIDDGYIKSPNQYVSDFIPGFPGFNDTPLTIRHLLTMSAGVDFQEAYSSPFSPTTQLYYGDDLQKVVHSMKEIEEPGKKFIYQSGVTQLLALLAEKAIGEDISSYVSSKLWTPMQAEEDALWSLDKKGGMEKAYCCFNSNARDFARFGQLILNKGAWNGKQLIADGYLAEATTPDTSLSFGEDGEVNNQYGFQFWSLTYDGMRIPYMRGILGQYVFAIPDKNMVIVRLGKKRSENRTAQHYPEDIDVWLGAGVSMVN